MPTPLLRAFANLHRTFIASDPCLAPAYGDVLGAMVLGEKMWIRTACSRFVRRAESSLYDRDGVLAANGPPRSLLKQVLTAVETLRDCPDDQFATMAPIVAETLETAFTAFRTPQVAP